MRNFSFPRFSPVIANFFLIGILLLATQFFVVSDVALGRTSAQGFTAAAKMVSFLLLLENLFERNLSKTRYTFAIVAT